jgi:hypothetical protein
MPSSNAALLSMISLSLAQWTRTHADTALDIETQEEKLLTFDLTLTSKGHDTYEAVAGATGSGGGPGRGGQLRPK